VRRSRRRGGQGAGLLVGGRHEVDACSRELKARQLGNRHEAVERVSSGLEGFSEGVVGVGERVAGAHGGREQVGPATAVALGRGRQGGAVAGAGVVDFCATAKSRARHVFAWGQISH
jgi:hypothetical protein